MALASHQVVHELLIVTAAPGADSSPFGLQLTGLSCLWQLATGCAVAMCVGQFVVEPATSGKGRTVLFQVVFSAFYAWLPMLSMFCQDGVYCLPLARPIVHDTRAEHCK